MIKNLTGESHDLTEQEPLNVGGARQMLLEMLQLIEAKSLAHRLAFRVLVQELTAQADPGAALRIQAQLDAIRWDPAMLGEDDNAIRQAVAQELSNLIESLDALVSSS